MQRVQSADANVPSQELEALLEKGAISDEAYESIHAALPSESPLSSAPAAAAPAPAPRVVSPPTNGMAAMNIHQQQPTPPPQQQPPSYNQTTAAAPPALPNRNQPPPAAPPSKPVIAHARALYRYQASDARDCSFEKDDRIAVYEYMNADWWMGRNERTGQEGIFPKTYVEPTGHAGPPPSSHSPYPNEKAGFNGYAAPAQPTYGGYPPPAPAQQNPYNNNVPPMAVAEGGQPAQEGDGKGKEMGKKFGKKLGNAAIFGAGATIGSNIVNSIF